MKNLIIIGARGCGREICNLATESYGYETEFRLKGFLDDKTDALDGCPGYPPIIAPVESYEPEADDVFISALGSPVWRRKYVAIVEERGGVFRTLVSRLAWISRNAVIGPGCAIFGGTGIGCDTAIGAHTQVQGYAVMGHDVRVGSFCQISCGTFFGGGATVDDGVTLYPHAIVLPHKRVGSGATVGAAAVVVRNVRPGDTVYGNPAQRLKY